MQLDLGKGALHDSLTFKKNFLYCIYPGRLVSLITQPRKVLIVVHIYIFQILYWFAGQLCSLRKLKFLLQAVKTGRNTGSWKLRG